MTLHRARAPSRVAQGCCNWATDLAKINITFEKPDFLRVRALALSNGLSFAEQTRRLVKVALAQSAAQ